VSRVLPGVAPGLGRRKCKYEKEPRRPEYLASNDFQPAFVPRPSRFGFAGVVLCEIRNVPTAVDRTVSSTKILGFFITKVPIIILHENIGDAPYSYQVHADIDTGYYSSADCWIRSTTLQQLPLSESNYYWKDDCWVSDDLIQKGPQVNYRRLDDRARS
jgi:hypothetical protein